MQDNIFLQMKARFKSNSLIYTKKSKTKTFKLLEILLKLLMQKIHIFKDYILIFLKALHSANII